MPDIHSPWRLWPISDAVLAGSVGRPILIFKHSITCGTSEVAPEEKSRNSSELIEGKRCPSTLRGARSAGPTVSNEIEARMRVTSRIAAGAAHQQRSGHLARFTLQGHRQAMAAAFRQHVRT